MAFKLKNIKTGEEIEFNSPNVKYKIKNNVAIVDDIDANSSLEELGKFINFLVRNEHCKEDIYLIEK